jgi:hypothetical protein
MLFHPVICFFRIVLIGMLVSGCATSYKPIKPTTFSKTYTKEGLELAYEPDILRVSKNRKYARRASRKDIRIAMVQIRNTSGRDFVIDNDLFFISDTTRLKLINTGRLYKKTRQSVFIHLSWMALSLIVVPNDDVIQPVGIYFGPPLTIVSMISADYANVKYREDLGKFNLHGKTIPNNHAVIGLIGYKDPGTDSLSVDFPRKDN